MTSFVQQLIKYVHSYVAWYCILDIVCFRLVMSFYGTWQRRFRALGLCGENTLDKELLPGCFMYVQVFLLCFAFFWMVSFYTFTLDNAMCFVIDEYIWFGATLMWLTAPWKSNQVHIVSQISRKLLVNNMMHKKYIYNFG